MSRILEADETGSLTIPSEILGHPPAHSRYLVETEGQGIRIEPEPAATELKSTGYEERRRRRHQLAERISAVWPEGVSAVDAVSEQRQ